VVEWVEKFHGTLTKEFFLISQFYWSERYRGINYENWNFWIAVSKKKGFKIYFPKKKTDNSLSVELAKKYEIEEKASVYIFSVVDKTSLEKGISLIKEFLAKVKNKNEQK
jgi:hypothetical protein